MINFILNTEMINSEDIGNRILKVAFNQTNDLLFVGTTKGFRIIRTEDCKIISRRDHEATTYFSGGFTCISPMFSTELLCLVGSPGNSIYPPNIAYFWDNQKEDFKGEIRFRSEVKNVLLRRDKAVIVLEKITYVYDLLILKATDSIPTIENENGVAAVSYDRDQFILASLQTTHGHVKITNYYDGEVKSGLIHENPITLLALNFPGTIGASASEQGTIIRVFDTKTLQLLHELRRGTSPAQVSSIAFSPNCHHLLASSNRSTIHVWNLKAPTPQSAGRFSRFLPNYFQYNRSLAKLSLKPEVSWTCPYTVNVGPIGCFIDETNFILAHLDGNLYKCKIRDQSALIIQETKSFLDSNEIIIEGNREWESFA
ncbi:unnamed protein product [Blepharisma stoltei]|uniref:Uncharacterized protein n=1 Tax=Blepharisma stoltei TaxID=1481888 RepID=A0AAU9I8Y0_9CILI|nr:unnamed protein product [Blepharisma stoltei]